MHGSAVDAFCYLGKEGCMHVVYIRLHAFKGF